MLTQIEHKSNKSLYKDHSLDPRGMNDDPAKIERLTTYIHPWRTKDGALTKAALQTIVSDQFADHNIGGLGVFFTQESGTSVLKILVGVKKYNSDPSSPSSKLF